MTTTPLRSRPLDFVYFSYLLMHTFATLIVDLQVLYPPNLTPQFMKDITTYYLTTYNDPLIGGVTGWSGTAEHFIWFKTFIYVEAFFQLPCFLLGMRGLWKGSHMIYIVLLIYATSATITTLPCLTVILSTPLTSTETVSAGVISITPLQKSMLLMSYVPFLLVPMMMTVDMGIRVWKLVSVANEALKNSKQK